MVRLPVGATLAYDLELVADLDQMVADLDPPLSWLNFNSTPFLNTYLCPHSVFIFLNLTHHTILVTIAKFEFWVKMDRLLKKI